MIYVHPFFSIGQEIPLQKALTWRLTTFSPRPPCFIFTVSWGVVFGLRLPLETGLTMKMPVREHSTHKPRGGSSSERNTSFSLPLGVSLLFWFPCLVEDVFSAKGSRVISFHKDTTGMSSLLRLGFPQLRLITSVSWPFHGMWWGWSGALKSCSIISCGLEL